MNKETYEALKFIAEMLHDSDFVMTSEQLRKDLERVETWIDEVAKEKEIDIYDAEHPLRRKAIRIVESVIEPLVGEMTGEDYYSLEDGITEILNEKVVK